MIYAIEIHGRATIAFNAPWFEAAEHTISQSKFGIKRALMEPRSGSEALWNGTDEITLREATLKEKAIFERAVDGKNAIQDAELAADMIDDMRYDVFVVDISD